MLKTNTTVLEGSMKRIFIFLLFIMGTVWVSAQKDSLSAENKNLIVSHSQLTKEPQFPGGARAFMNLVTAEIVHENFKNTGIKTYVVFLVDRDGKMTNIKVNSPYEDIQKELLRVFQKISLRYKWEPGEVNGEKVRTQMRQPIVIHSAY
ncbi:hypothetical protein [Chryseobacterium sp.]|uniref:hypothetical protein n=1 Tax=Chryseobacterium sp. TaxID=1871047 RepID=UPI0025C140AE|nr:hypothetical protein [Chryseobacterium sp.]